MEQSERGESRRAGRAATKDVVVPTTVHAVPDNDMASGSSETEAVRGDQADAAKKKPRKEKEELIGEPAKANKAAAGEADGELLGRARATEKSFAPEAKADRKRAETPEMRFAELRRQTSA